MEALGIQTLLSVLQVTSRRPTCGPSRSCPSWRSPWCFCRMWQMAPCMKEWPTGLTPPVPCSSTCFWCSVTLPSATSTTPGSLNTSPSCTERSCLVTVASPAVTNTLVLKSWNVCDIFRQPNTEQAQQSVSECLLCYEWLKHPVSPY